MKKIINKSLAAVYTHTCNSNEIKNNMKKYINKSYVSNKNGGITLIVLLYCIVAMFAKRLYIKKFGNGSI